MKTTYKFWTRSVALIVAAGALAQMDALGAFATIALASIAYALYRTVWVTRDAGPYRVSRIPLVAPGGGA